LILDSIGVTDSKSQLIINGCLNIVGLIVAVTNSFFIERVGRRRLLMGSLAFCCLVYTLETIFAAIVNESNFTNKGMGYGVVAMVYLFNGANHVTAPTIEVYIQEVLTFTLRSKGTVVYQMTGTICSIFSSFVNPIALAAISWRYYIVYSVALLLWIILIYFFAPETKGLSLEEVSLVFDGTTAISTHEAAQQTYEKGNDVQHLENVPQSVV